MTDKTHPNETTEKQIAANQANAQHSTGPRSRAGKQASALSALQNGLYAEHPVAIRKGVFEEDEETIDEYLARIVASYEPRDDVEFDQARRIAILRLKCNRLDRYERYLIGAAGTPDEPVSPRQHLDMQYDCTLSAELVEAFDEPDGSMTTRPSRTS